MKQKFTIFLASIGLMLATYALPLAGIIESTGCTSSQQTTAYKTLASVGSLVDNAEKAYSDLLVKGVIPASTLPTEAKAYNDFQAAFNLAVVAAGFSPSQPLSTNVAAPQNVIDLGNAFVALIAQLQGGK